MVEQEVTLAPGESKLVSFEATPHETKTYHVSINGLTGSFFAIRPSPSARLISLRNLLQESIEDCEEGLEMIYCDKYGIRDPCTCVSLVKGLMIEEAISIGLIKSSADCYFANSHMYYSDGTLIV